MAKSTARNTKKKATSKTTLCVVSSPIGLNMRNAPGGKIIDVLQYGVELELLSSVEGEWANVKHGNEIGWVMAKYIWQEESGG